MESGFSKWKKNGLVEYFDENGVLYQSSNFKNNQLHGENLEFYPSGNIKTKVSYKKGKFDGEFISYFEDGLIKMKELYSQNERVDYTSYDKDGNLIDHKLKYEIEESKDGFKIRVLNKRFHIVGLAVGISDNRDSLITIDNDYSIDGDFDITIPDKYLKNKEFFFQLFEIDSINESIEQGVVRSEIQFEYKISKQNP